MQFIKGNSHFLFACVAITFAPCVALSQERIDAQPPPTAYIVSDRNAGSPGLFDFGRGNPSYLTGNHDFDRFIGFMSNPLQNIDPRAVTEIWPMFGSSWVSGNGPLLAQANAQIYGAGLYVALSDRLSVGLNQGGIGALHLSSDRAQQLANLGFPVPERARGGQRQGWLNLGGFVQYTVIADVENQFLLTAGLRWEAPSGATQVFQGGDSPAYLAPYLTLGKEFGCWHFLATTGYEFPAGSGTGTTNLFYLNLHLDRQIGWLYPLVEFNAMYHTSTVDVNLPTRHGVLDLGTFSSSGNLVMMAVGANAVLVPSRLELGAVYLHPIASQDRFNYDGLLVKMVVRY